MAMWSSSSQWDVRECLLKSLWKDVPILRKQVQETMASHLLLDIAVSGLTPGIAAAWLRKTLTLERKEKGMERIQVSEVQLWSSEVAIMRDKKYSSCLDHFELGVFCNLLQKVSYWYPSAHTCWFQVSVDSSELLKSSEWTLLLGHLGNLS